MSLPDDERMLREAFDEIRRADAERTPPFSRMWRAPHSTAAVRRPLVWIAAAALLLLIAATMLVRRPPRPVNLVSIPPMEWKAPTDFLLDTPGSSLSRSVPQLQPPIPNYSLKGTSK